MEIAKVQLMIINDRLLRQSWGRKELEIPTLSNLTCNLLLEKKKKKVNNYSMRSS